MYQIKIKWSGFQSTRSGPVRHLSGYEFIIYLRWGLTWVSVAKFEKKSIEKAETKLELGRSDRSLPTAICSFVLTPKERNSEPANTFHSSERKKNSGALSLSLSCGRAAKWKKGSLYLFHPVNKLVGYSTPSFAQLLELLCPPPFFITTVLTFRYIILLFEKISDSATGKPIRKSKSNSYLLPL